MQGDVALKLNKDSPLKHLQKVVEIYYYIKGQQTHYIVIFGELCSNIIV